MEYDLECPHETIKQLTIMSTQTFYLKESIYIHKKRRKELGDLGGRYNKCTFFLQLGSLGNLGSLGKYMNSCESSVIPNAWQPTLKEERVLLIADTQGGATLVLLGVLLEWLHCC